MANKSQVNIKGKRCSIDVGKMVVAVTQLASLLGKQQSEVEISAEEVATNSPLEQSDETLGRAA